jgi:hypothetical protein
MLVINSKVETLNFKPHTQNPKIKTSKLQHGTLNFKP